MEFRLLGRMEAIHNGHSIPLGRRRERLLLALLLLEVGTVVSAERLIALLWDDDPPATARASLHTHISRLRAALSPGNTALTSHANGYLLAADPKDVDVHVFQDLVRQARRTADPASRTGPLREALRLWRGPLLADLPRVRDWLGVELTQQRLDAIDLLYTSELEVGRHREIIAELSSLVAEYPTNETLTAHLMLALHRADDRPGALNVFGRLRARLAEELGLDPGQALQELRTAILRDDATLRLATRRHGPAQLPPDVGNFSGRVWALRELDEHALQRRGASTTVLIAAISGTGGVGKTALAVHWGHMALGHFPDGQLYVNLLGYDTGEPKSPATALDGFLRALGAERIPADLDERAALYRSLLARRRMLIILDNARSAEQVRPLLTGTGDSVVLVTSRDMMPGLVARDGAQRLVLDRLGEDEAMELLRSVLGAARIEADPDGARRLVRLTAGLPLALRIAAERATARPGTALTQLATELAGHALDSLSNPEDRATALRVVFSWSYRTLTPAAARLFRLLGVHPGAGWELHAAANLAGQDPATTGALLATLAAAHLIERAGQGRFGMHDLLREYARELASEDDEAVAAQRRLTDWYLHTVTDAMDQLVPTRRRAVNPAETPCWPHRGFAGYAAALDWLDIEMPALSALVEQTPGADLPERCRHLAHELAQYLDIRGYQDEALHLHQVAAEAALRADDIAGFAEAMHNLGTTRYGIGQYADALGALYDAIAARRRSGDPHGEAASLCALGNVFIHLGEVAEAAGQYREALDLARRVGSTRGIACALHNLGTAAKIVGAFEEAFDYFDQALAIRRESGDRRGESLTLGNIGAVKVRLGRLREALAILHEALAIADETGDRPIAGFNANHLGVAYTELGDIPTATAYQQRALTIAREVHDTDGEVAALTGLGVIHHCDGDNDQALTQLRQALSLCHQLRDPQRESQVRLALSESLIAAGDHMAARSHAEHALVLAIRSGDQTCQEHAERILGTETTQLSEAN